MNRRGFLGTILALGCAPAIVKAASLMPVRVYAGPCLVTIDQWQQSVIGRHWSARQQAHDALAQWLEERLDEENFKCLTAPNRLLATIPYGEARLELYAGRAPDLYRTI